jgi:hypothetical protein
LKNGPAESQQGLFIFYLDITPEKEIEQLPEIPELLPVYSQSGRWFNNLSIFFFLIHMPDAAS